MLPIYVDIEFTLQSFWPAYFNTLLCWKYLSVKQLCSFHPRNALAFEENRRCGVFLRTLTTGNRSVDVSLHTDPTIHLSLIISQRGFYNPFVLLYHKWAAPADTLETAIQCSIQYYREHWIGMVCGWLWPISKFNASFSSIQLKECLRQLFGTQNPLWDPTERSVIVS